VILQASRFAELDPRTLYALLRLRCDIFVVEQQCAYPELDGRDDEPGTLHVWLAQDGDPVAYLRVLTEPDGTARIGRVCTAKEHRGTGLGARLMAEALDRIGPDRPCVLDAQLDAIRLYERFGFVPCGPQYVEDGIAHLPMRRTLA
jgi:ElaA protein